MRKPTGPSGKGPSSKNGCGCQASGLRGAAGSVPALALWLGIAACLVRRRRSRSRLR
jgi:hypothetical protein